MWVRLVFLGFGVLQLRECKALKRKNQYSRSESDLSTPAGLNGPRLLLRLRFYITGGLDANHLSHLAPSISISGVALFISLLRAASISITCGWIFKAISRTIFSLHTPKLFADAFYFTGKKLNHLN